MIHVYTNGGMENPMFLPRSLWWLVYGVLQLCVTIQSSNHTLANALPRMAQCGACVIFGVACFWCPLRGRRHWKLVNSLLHCDFKDTIFHSIVLDGIPDHPGDVFFDLSIDGILLTSKFTDVAVVSVQRDLLLTRLWQA